MLYTEKEKNEIERVRKVFEKHIQQMTAYDLVWSDKVGYVWLAISIDPVYIDTGNWIESAAGLCYECLNDIALDVFGMTGNDHDFEDADPLELAEIKRRWKPYIDHDDMDLYTLGEKKVALYAVIPDNDNTFVRPDRAPCNAEKWYCPA